MLSKDGNLKIKIHKSCIFSYTSFSHLNRSKRKLEKEKYTPQASKKV